MPGAIFLDWNRYLNSKSNNILNNLPYKRPECSVSSTDMGIFNPKCRFTFKDHNHDKSEEEEKEFNTFLKSLSTILCEDNYSDSCILKIYHFSKFDIFLEVDAKAVL